ncbi:hypothetical protein AGMMS49545_18670 [Betaproteobacteria bacterium]|nr:hypothetical protein AGMMS49545_18670 [Betaproteobacteria bacterium]GHU13376.1 hypothetical protein FACS189441_0720 [Betaproteobacteria bacterium]
MSLVPESRVDRVDSTANPNGRVTLHCPDRGNRMNAEDMLCNGEAARITLLPLWGETGKGE